MLNSVPILDSVMLLLALMYKLRNSGLIKYISRYYLWREKDRGTKKGGDVHLTHRSSYIKLSRMLLMMKL